jgi:hypothetical protein
LKSNATNKLAQELLLSVETAAWNTQRLAEEATAPESFAVFQQLVSKAGRPELATAPALNILRYPIPKQKHPSGHGTRYIIPKQWHSPNIGLNHLFQVLSYARQASPEEIAHFIETIATPDWLDDRFSVSANNNSLAENLLYLSIVLPEHLHYHFLRSSLELRVKQAITECKPTDYPAWFTAILLLDTTTLLGLKSTTCPNHLHNQQIYLAYSNFTNPTQLEPASNLPPSTTMVRFKRIV